MKQRQSNLTYLHLFQQERMHLGSTVYPQEEKKSAQYLMNVFKLAFMLT